MRFTRFSLFSLLILVAIAAIAIAVVKYAYGPTLNDGLREEATRGDLDSAKWYLIWGADIDHGDWTPVMHATFENQPEMVAFLIERGAELDHEEYHDSYTSLRLAEFQGFWDIAILLAKAGASDHIDDGSGWYVINYARHAGREDVVDVLWPWHEANQTEWEARQAIDNPPAKPP